MDKVRRPRTSVRYMEASLWENIQNNVVLSWIFYMYETLFQQNLGYCLYSIVLNEV